MDCEESRSELGERDTDMRAQEEHSRRKTLRLSPNSNQTRKRHNKDSRVRQLKTKDTTTVRHETVYRCLIIFNLSSIPRLGMTYSTPHSENVQQPSLLQSQQFGQFFTSFFVHDPRLQEDVGLDTGSEDGAVGEAGGKRRGEKRGVQESTPLLLLTAGG